MKKALAMLLAVLLVLTGTAFAEMIWTPNGGYTVQTDQNAVNPYDRAMLLDLGAGLALIGSGDGSAVFERLAPQGESYAERFAGLWNAMGVLMPVKSAEGALSFAPNGRGGTLVSVNGEAVAELNGVVCYAMLQMNSQQLHAADGCDVRIWGPAQVISTQGGASAANICLNCGGYDDGSAIHHTPISQFCDEGHTVCMGDPTHICPSCGKSYPCSKSNSHTECLKFGNYWCFKSRGDHKTLACGHRGCEVYGNEAGHALCTACGGYLCDGANHTLAPCGVHHVNAAGDHTAAFCGYTGHYACDGRDHSKCTPPAE